LLRGGLRGGLGILAGRRTGGDHRRKTHKDQEGKVRATAR